MHECQTAHNQPEQTGSTFNLNAHFIGPNPPTSFNPKSVMPTVAPTASIGPFSSVIGDVTVCENVFIAPNVSVRADEGSPFYIGAHTNLQDGVIVHGLAGEKVAHNGRQYSIYIGEHVSCAHGCIVHGPCKIGDRAFIGFHTVVMNCIIGEGCVLSPNVLVTGGVKLPPDRFVPAGTIVDTQEKADRLPPVPNNQVEFAQGVQNVNNAFPAAYALTFGSVKCSCGLACDRGTLKCILE